MLQDPGQRAKFETTAVAALSQPHACAETFDQILTQTMPSVTSSKCAPTASPDVPNLALYWQSKQHLRRSLELLRPCLFDVSWTTMLTAALQLRSARVNLVRLLQTWRAATSHQRIARTLNRQIRNNKKSKAKAIIAQALEADAKGLTYVCKAIHRLQPKNPKRPVHFKHPQHGLLTAQHSLQQIRDYFGNLYQTPENPQPRAFYLAEPPAILREEVASWRRCPCAKPCLRSRHQLLYGEPVMIE